MKINSSSRPVGIREYAVIVVLVALTSWGVYCYFGETIRAQTAGMARQLGGRDDADSPKMVDRLLEAAPNGNAVLKTPRSVRQYEEFDVALVVSAKDLASLRGTAQPGLDDDSVRSRVDIAKIPLTAEVTAELSGPDFTLVTPARVTQAVGFEQESSFHWRVQANWPGTHSLTLMISSNLTRAEPKLSRNMPYLTKQIDVSLNVFELVRHNLEFALTAILLPIAAFSLRTVLRGLRPD